MCLYKSSLQLTAIVFYRDVQEELFRQQQARCADAVGTKLIFQHMVSLVEEVASDVYQTDVVDRLDTLEEAERLTKVVRCRRMFRQWTAVYK